MSAYATIYVLPDNKMYASVDAGPCIFIGIALNPTYAHALTVLAVLESHLVWCKPGTTDIQFVSSLPKEGTII